MATIPGPAPKDPNFPKSIRKLYCGPWQILKNEKGLTTKEAGKEWSKLSDSQKKKYGEKAKKNREKGEVLKKKYKKTPQYTEWMQKRKEWLRSVKVFYPPKPRKDSKDYEEEMRIWHRSCRRLKLSAKEGRLEGSKWITMYLRRKELEQEARERRKIKKKEKGRKNRRLKRNKLAAIKKNVKNVKVKTGKKGKKKGAKKLNQSKKGKKLEKKLKKKQAQKKELAAITKGMKNVMGKANKKRKKKGVKRA